ncbi:hypothetical protein J7F01_17215 [Streptomyces sp. ISL-22]|nr:MULTISPECIES: hypothetical protein [unclassified Streptomyces]MBT2420017.1 hypothetical protein [Streptomyces sp. ISL-24]MBT2433891.1 hypothetical protein [Streptomyces sp. ISL-22]
MPTPAEDGLVGLDSPAEERLREQTKPTVARTPLSPADDVARQPAR